MTKEKAFFPKTGYITLQSIYNLAAGLTEGILTIYFVKKGLSFTQIGFIWSMMLVINALTDFPTGTFADRYGRLKIYCLGLIFMGSGYIIFGYGQMFQIFLLATLFIGIGESLISGALVAWIVDIYQSKGESDMLVKTLGNVKLISSIAGILGGILEGLLFKNHLAEAFYIHGGLLIVSAIVHYLVLPDNFGSSQDSVLKMSFSSLQIFLKSRALYHFTLATINWYLIYTFFLFTWQPLGVKMGFSEHILGYVNSVYILFTGVGGYIWAALEKRIGKNVLMLISIISMGISFGAFGLVKGKISFLLTMALFAFSYGSYFPLFTKWKNDYIPKEVRASVMSLITSISSGTVILAQIFVGKLMDLSGFDLIFRLGVIVVGIQLINLGWLMKSEKTGQITHSAYSLPAMRTRNKHTIQR